MANSLAGLRPFVAFFFPFPWLGVSEGSCTRALGPAIVIFALSSPCATGTESGRGRGRPPAAVFGVVDGPKGDR